MEPAGTAPAAMGAIGPKAARRSSSVMTPRPFPFYSGKQPRQQGLSPAAAKGGTIMESSQALDPTRAAQAVKLGLFIDAAYQMWKNHPGVAAPPPPSQLPDGYSFAAWVQMRDFLFASGDLLFYGLIAHSPDGGDSILAIRGTQTVEEWLDNLTSLVPA